MYAWTVPEQDEIMTEAVGGEEDLCAIGDDLEDEIEVGLGN